MVINMFQVLDYYFFNILLNPSNRIKKGIKNYIQKEIDWNQSINQLFFFPSSQDFFILLDKLPIVSGYQKGAA